MLDATQQNAPCELCHNPLAMPYQGHTFCASCVLRVCGNCWKARVVETWSKWRFRKPLLIKCPQCGWRNRVAA